MTNQPSAHWENVYATKDAAEVSWFEESPALSLELIAGAYDGRGGVIDIGGGASRLAGALVEAGYAPVAVLDLSANALAVAKAKLEKAAECVEWIVADVTAWDPAGRFDVWHDRAAFHFLIDSAQQQAYAQALRAAPGPVGQRASGKKSGKSASGSAQKHRALRSAIAAGQSASFNPPAHCPSLPIVTRMGRDYRPGSPKRIERVARKGSALGSQFN
jgi:SAM-dependent methyltransferase